MLSYGPQAVLTEPRHSGVSVIGAEINTITLIPRVTYSTGAFILNNTFSVDNVSILVFRSGNPITFLIIRFLSDLF